MLPTLRMVKFGR